LTHGKQGLGHASGSTPFASRPSSAIDANAASQSGAVSKITELALA
jgi:hypothetical protein